MTGKWKQTWKLLLPLGVDCGSWPVTVGRGHFDTTPNKQPQLRLVNYNRYRKMVTEASRVDILRCVSFR